MRGRVSSVILRGRVSSVILRGRVSSVILRDRRESQDLIDFNDMRSCDPLRGRRMTEAVGPQDDEGRRGMTDAHASSSSYG